MQGEGGFLSITIDFQQSHLFFPRIMIGVIIVLVVAIAIKELLSRARKGTLKELFKGFSFFEPGFNKAKLFGTFGLVILYFVLMDYVGRLFPNEGLGFLSTSIPFMLALSVLFAGKEVVKKHWIAIVVSSVVTPLAAWLLFGKLFFITLP